METAIKTEDQVIIAYTNEAILNSRLSLDKFASDHLVPALEADGVIEKSNILDAEQYSHWRSKNCMQFHRVMRGTTKFPLSWKWSWIGVLPEPYQTNCRRELLAIAGVLDIPIPSFGLNCAGSAKSHLPSIMQEFSEMVAASSPAHDGALDGKDKAELAMRYGNELIDIKEAIERELQALQSGTGVVLDRSSMH